jgi:RimJ/RimL family protein N-acetyltransferase
MNYVGRRVFFRQVERSDYDILRQLELGDDLGSRWRFGGSTPSPEEFPQRFWAGSVTQLLVCDRETGARVGLASLSNVNFVVGHGYFSLAKFDRDDRTGKILDGAVLFLEHVFSAFPLRKVYLEVAGYSLGQFLSGVGDLFEEEGRLREHVFADGKFWDVTILSLARSRWEDVKVDALAFASDRAQQLSEAR